MAVAVRFWTGLTSILADALSLGDSEQKPGSQPLGLNTETLDALLDGTLLNTFLTRNLRSCNPISHIGIVLLTHFRVGVKKFKNNSIYPIDSSFAYAYSNPRLKSGVGDQDDKRTK